MQAPETKTLIRRTSPDGKLDAILYSEDAGATTTVSYEIVVTEKGGSLNSGKLLVSMDHGDPSKFDLTWTSSQKLSAYLGDADVYLTCSPGQVGGAKVEVDFSAQN